jgi:hypothetical protein
VAQCSKRRSFGVEPVKIAPRRRRTSSFARRAKQNKQVCNNSHCPFLTLTHCIKSKQRREQISRHLHLQQAFRKHYPKSLQNPSLRISSRQQTNKQPFANTKQHWSAERYSHSSSNSSTTPLSSKQQWVSCGLKALAESTQVSLTLSEHQHTPPSATCMVFAAPGSVVPPRHG